MFLKILLAGLALVLVQALLAYRDGYFSQKQLRAKGLHAGSFSEHGGMWADVFIISPTVAFILSRYHLPYRSFGGMALLVAMASVTGLLLWQYQNAGRESPGVHARDGRTTLAGWVHGAYALLALWVLGMFYLLPLQPHASTKHILAVTCALTPFFYLGAVTQGWQLARKDYPQVIVLTIGVWVMATIKICY